MYEDVRTRVTVMTELLALTDNMLGNRENPDALVTGVEERQMLMDEFDSLPDDLTPEETDEVRKMAKDILAKDKLISTSLSEHRSEAKKGLSANMHQQKLLGYTNNAIAGSGSYMDYKK